MRYAIKEMYYSLQGEGINAGRPAVLIRFAGCNLWSGAEQDRASALCPFCDTDFVGTDGPGGGTFTATELARHARRLWPEASGTRPFAICTGGEPLLQLDQTLVNALHESGFEIALETNGTLPPPEGIDWLCVSPKTRTKLALREGHELKLVFPQAEADPQDYLQLAFEHFCLQPLAGPDLEENTRQAIAYCLEHPRWRLSLQLHKYVGIP